MLAIRWYVQFTSSGTEPYADKISYTENAAAAGLRNQKLGLCFACLHSSNFETGFEIMDRLPPYFALTHIKIRKLLCQLLHATIEPLYRGLVSKYARSRKVPALNVEPCQTLADLPATVFPLLKRLGFYISYDVLLLTKILRICKACVAEKVKGDGYLHQADVEHFLGEAAIPSFSLLEPGNPALLEEAWAVLKTLPYATRYRMYGRWKNELLSSHALLIFSKKLVVKNTSYVMKRISKETLRIYGRVIGKLSHSNPGTLFEGILDKVMVYNNFIEPVAESLKYLTDFSFDVLGFVIVEALANPDKQRLKASDINVGLWLNSLSKFCGFVFRKYSIELSGLLQYVT